MVRVTISDRAGGLAARRQPARPPRRSEERGLRGVPREHRRVRVAAAAELARRGQSRGQGSGPAAIRQHLQQPRARRVRAEGEVPAQRPVLHREHGGRRRSRAAESGLERPLRIVAVPRRVSRHAGRSLRAEAEEPPDTGPGRRPDRGAARRRQAARHVAARSLRRGDEGADARPARSRRRCARVRQPRLAPAADGGREGESARVLSEVPHREPASITTPRSARCSRASWSRRPSSIAWRPSPAVPRGRSTAGKWPAG